MKRASVIEGVAVAIFFLLVALLTGATSAAVASNVIAGGGLHTLAVQSDGTVWAWGWNKGGQLGDGTTTDRWTPARVSGLTNVSAVAAGGWYSLALKTDGTVWAWGSNFGGQLGDGTTTDRLTPTQSLFSLSTTDASPVPTTQENFSCALSVSSSKDTTPSQLVPIGVGSFASDGDTISLHR